MLCRYGFISLMLLAISLPSYAGNSISLITGQAIKNRCGLIFPNKETLDSEGSDFDPEIYNCNDYETLLYKVAKKNFDAMRMLGIMYERGFIVPQNTSKAIEILEEAANLGDVATQSYLGSGETDILFSQTQKTDGTFDFDDSRMLYWRNKAANNGDSYSQYLLAAAAEETAPTKAIEWYEKSAKSGFVQAMTTLANIYYNGEITQKSLEQAIYWNEQAVLAGDAYQAPLQLYQIYFDSKKDKLLSTAWLGKFCSNPDLGNNERCNILDKEIKPSVTAKQAFDIGMLYFEEGLLQNYILSEQWFSTSCKKGNSFACEYSENAIFRHRYGFVQGLSPIEYWEKGRELERTRKIGDPFLEDTYYFEAARKGFSEAQIYLGKYYIDMGNQSNYTKAKRWLEISLNSNDTSIQREAYLGLGILYYDGLGIRRNVYTGRNFIGKSCDMGLEQACQTYARLFIQ